PGWAASNSRTADVNATGSNLRDSQASISGSSCSSRRYTDVGWLTLFFAARFRGLLAPGSDRTSGEEDLVAVWRTTKGQRFQNYRARFTVLDAGSVTRSWIKELAAGEPLGARAAGGGPPGPGCPPAWRSWVKTGRYLPLQAPPTVITRSRGDQEPDP